MVFREVGPDYSFPDHSRPITGKQGNPALQSNDKLVTRTGAPQSVADIDINDHELTNGDFETGQIDIGGTSGIAMSVESDQSNGFEVFIDLYDDDGNVVGVIDQTDYAELQDTDLTVVVPVFSDRVEIRIRDTSNNANNTISGSINANIGTPTRLNAEVTGGQIAIEGASGSIFGDQSLDTAVPTTESAMVTYLSRALNSVGIEEFVTRVTDTTGTQVDPLNQDVLQTAANDELRARVFGPDAGGVLQQANAEQFDTALATTDVGVATYTARALATLGQDELLSRLTDSTGTQIDPSQQESFDSVYTSIDLNTTGTTTIYNGTTEAKVYSVHLQNSGGTADVRLEVTDGTNTAVLDDPGAGGSVHFSEEVAVGPDDDLQIVVEAAEGSALTETAVVSRGEL